MKKTLSRFGEDFVRTLESHRLGKGEWKLYAQESMRAVEWGVDQMKARLRMYHVRTDFPVVREGEQLRLAKNLRGVANQERMQGMKPIKPRAVLRAWDGKERDEIKPEVCDTADIGAMRLYSAMWGSMPLLLQAGAIVTCPDTRSLLMQRDVLGGQVVYRQIQGSYLPRLVTGEEGKGCRVMVKGDQHSLGITLARKLAEVTGRMIEIGEGKPVSCVADFQDNKLVFTVMGIRLKAEQARKIREGMVGQAASLCWVKYDELENIMLGSEAQRRYMQPLAKANMLLWMSMGAPAAGFSVKFGKKTPRELYDQMLVAMASGPAMASQGMSQQEASLRFG